MSRLSASLALLVVSLAPSGASAWADASVRSARARVELEDGIRVRVALSVDVRVDGGWLEAFELDGLDAGLALDESVPPTFVEIAHAEAEGGPDVVVPLAPRVSSHERGRVSFSFGRRHAPRRGDYRVEVTYVAPLASTPEAAEGGTRLGWTFPAWRFGLDGVEIDLLLPPGSMLDPELRAAADADAGILIETGEHEDGRARLHLVRHHLPRTRAWPVAFLVPSSVVPAPEREASAPPPVPRVVAPRETAVPIGTIVGVLVLFVLVLAKNAVIFRKDAEAGRTRPAERFARTLVAAAGVALAGFAAWVAPPLAPAAILVVTISGMHGAPGERSVAPGAFRAASPAWIRSALGAERRTRLGLSALVSAWERPGALVLFALALALFAAVRSGLVPAAHAVLLGAGAAVVLGLGRRAIGEDAPRVLLGRVLTWVGRVSLPESALAGVAFLPLVYAETNGRVRTARVRVVLDEPPLGLVRFDIVLLDDERPAIVLSARAGSEAARRLATLAPLLAHGREREGLVLPVESDLGEAIGTAVEVLRTEPTARASREALRPAA